jgi:hypothetical protein
MFAKAGKSKVWVIQILTRISHGVRANLLQEINTSLIPMGRDTFSKMSNQVSVHQLALL